MIRKMIKDKKRPIDELLNNLVSNAQNKKRLTCKLCEEKVNTLYMTKHLVNTHSK